MNKIRKYLINLLGCVTKEQCEREATLAHKNERAMAISFIKWKMEACYGMPADEWCKAVYEHTCNRHKQAMSDLACYKRNNITSCKQTKKKT